MANTFKLLRTVWSILTSLVAVSVGIDTVNPTNSETTYIAWPISAFHLSRPDIPSPLVPTC